MEICCVIISDSVDWALLVYGPREGGPTTKA